VRIFQAREARPRKITNEARKAEGFSRTRTRSEGAKPLRALNIKKLLSIIYYYLTMATLVPESETDTVAAISSCLSAQPVALETSNHTEAVSAGLDNPKVTNYNVSSLQKCSDKFELPLPKREKAIPLRDLCTGRYGGHDYDVPGLYGLAPYFDCITTYDLPFLTREDILKTVGDKNRLLAILFINEKLSKYLTSTGDFKLSSPEDTFLNDILVVSNEIDENTETGKTDESSEIADAIKSDQIATLCSEDVNPSDDNDQNLPGYVSISDGIINVRYLEGDYESVTISKLNKETASPSIMDTVKLEQVRIMFDDSNDPYERPPSGITGINESITEFINNA